MTYSLDFRTRVFQIQEKKGLTFEPVSHQFDLSIRTLFRWQKKLKPTMTRNKPATRVEMALLAQDIEFRPDDYQWELAKRFGLAQSTIHYALLPLGVSYKKNVATSKGQPTSADQLATKN